MCSEYIVYRCVLVKVLVLLYSLVNINKLLSDVINNGDITMHIHEINALKGNDSTLHEILFVFCSLCIITNQKMFRMYVRRLCVRSNRELHVELVMCGWWA